LTKKERKMREKEMKAKEKEGGEVSKEPEKPLTWEEMSRK